MIPTRRQGFQRSLESAFVVELIALEGPGCPAPRAGGREGHHLVCTHWKGNLDPRPKGAM